MHTATLKYTRIHTENTHGMEKYTRRYTRAEIHTDAHEYTRIHTDTHGKKIHTGDNTHGYTRNAHGYRIHTDAQ